MYITSSVVGKVQAAISLLDEVLDDRFALGQVLGVHKFGLPMSAYVSMQSFLWDSAAR